MDIVNRRLAEIHPYENNPRFNDDAVDAVAASIQEFGFKVPIVLDSEGVIVAGHTRWKAALKLQLETVPCVVADDLSPEQIKAFRLADNKVAELAYWNEEALAKELEEIADIDMSAFGFDGEESALVIIDVGNAIANGYATLMGEVLDAMEGDGGNGNEG